MTHEVKYWAILFSVFAVFSIGFVLYTAYAVDQKVEGQGRDGQG
ncbi:MAG: hypothetical protein WC657_08135 [Candidatus Paceibacterota bacterium]|jgi:hypothetical protein